MADIGFNLLTEKYISNNNVGDIIKNDNYVKVIFKDDNYLNMSLDDIKIKFKDLNEVLRR